jgi:sec-independent protein translocase protein TatA
MRIGFWELMSILFIVLALFGTRRLRSLGAALSASFKGFREALKEGRQGTAETSAESRETSHGRIIEGEVIREDFTTDTPRKRQPKV